MGSAPGKTNLLTAGGAAARGGAPVAGDLGGCARPRRGGASLPGAVLGADAAGRAAPAAGRRRGRRGREVEPLSGEAERELPAPVGRAKGSTRSTRSSARCPAPSRRSSRRRSGSAWRRGCSRSCSRWRKARSLSPTSSPRTQSRSTSSSCWVRRGGSWVDADPRRVRALDVGAGGPGGRRARRGPAAVLGRVAAGGGRVRSGRFSRAPRHRGLLGGRVGDPAAGAVVVVALLPDRPRQSPAGRADRPGRARLRVESGR